VFRLFFVSLLVQELWLFCINFHCLHVFVYVWKVTSLFIRCLTHHLLNRKPNCFDYPKPNDGPAASPAATPNWQLAQPSHLRLCIWQAQFLQLHHCSLWSPNDLPPHDSVYATEQLTLYMTYQSRGWYFLDSFELNHIHVLTFYFAHSSSPNEVPLTSLLSTLSSMPSATPSAMLSENIS
jgi:hypothetical protein